MIYLQADLKDIEENYLEFMPYSNFTKFFEPDLNNQLTTIAIHENDMSDRLKKKINKLKLWELNCSPILFMNRIIIVLFFLYYY